MKKPLLAAAVCCAMALSASAQQDAVQRFQRQLQQVQQSTRVQADPSIPVEQRTLFDYGGFLSLDFFAIDDINQNTHILRDYQIVGYGRLNIDGVHEFFLRARGEYRDFNAGDSFDGEGDEDSGDIDQAYYRFDLARYLGAYKGGQIGGRNIGNNNVTATVGRQFVYWANGLVLAETLDGGTVTGTIGDLELTFLGGRTAKRLTVDIDSSRPSFDSNTKRVFWGGMATYTLGKHRPFVYGLLQDDQNNSRYILSTADNTTRFRYDSWYIGLGSNGSIGDRLVYGAEFAYEGGEGLSNSFDPDTFLGIPQTREDVSAWAFDLRLDYLLPDERRTRLSAEFIIASGDDDRLHTTNTFGGNAPGSDDNAFNAFGLINTGLAFAPNVSNIVGVRLGASTFPFPNHSLFRRFQAGIDVHSYFKLEKDAPIDETTETDSQYLGVEPDLFLNWQITSDVTFALRYGVFFPGSAIVADENPRHFFFTGVTFAF